MGQTILCEYIANWEESGEQPDPTQYGWDNLLGMLREAQSVMFDLGTSCNNKAHSLNCAYSWQLYQHQLLSEIDTLMDTADIATERLHKDGLGISTLICVDRVKILVDKYRRLLNTLEVQ